MIIVRRTSQGAAPGSVARVVTGLAVWDGKRIVHEYAIQFEGGSGHYSVEEEDLAFNGPLDRLAREA